jgi:YHS domain-containing protein
VIRVILIAVLIFLIARAFWRVFDGVMDAMSGTTTPRGRRRSAPPSVRLVRDPVCGTHVPINAALSLTARGATHYFCSEQCRDTFQRRA